MCLYILIITNSKNDLLVARISLSRVLPSCPNCTNPLSKDFCEWIDELIDGFFKCFTCKSASNGAAGKGT